jgi:flagellar basal body rod protein FlgG
VRQGDASIGRLRIADFADAQRLEEDSRGNWRAPRGVVERASTAAVRQGSIEQANVNSMDELVGMVVAQRHFESSMTLMRTIDQTYKRINQPHN